MAERSPLPSDAEWKVLNALWREHPASARQLLRRLASEAWAYTTLKTMLTRMEHKGFVRARLRENTTWYEPAVEQRAVQGHAVRSLLQRAFDGAAGPLLAHLAEEQTLSAKERQQLLRWTKEFGPAERKRGKR